MTPTIDHVYSDTLILAHMEGKETFSAIVDEIGREEVKSRWEDAKMLYLALFKAVATQKGYTLVKRDNMWVRRIR